MILNLQIFKWNNKNENNSNGKSMFLYLLYSKIKDVSVNS